MLSVLFIHDNKQEMGCTHGWRMGGMKVTICDSSSGSKQPKAPITILKRLWAFKNSLEFWVYILALPLNNYKILYKILHCSGLTKTKTFLPPPFAYCIKLIYFPFLKKRRKKKKRRILLKTHHVLQLSRCDSEWQEGITTYRQNLALRIL